MEVTKVRLKQVKITAVFKQKVLRILSPSRRKVAQVAEYLGSGKSTLRLWKTPATEAELLSGPHPDMEKEQTRLRHEHKIDGDLLNPR